ncbi:hypothetical protein ASE14_01710 [Agromyces sp. Root81]|uniref:hypothetical protein n=1 Tax=Agromyces sp. Root81 TaxID=1736601 RepID=UPI0006F8ED58|nr:hypothetical protein [Agromyces sp. Root81]KRC62571.1 hypothetical protein ASE14_01710 [Agromyces sp. Root81]
MIQVRILSMRPLTAMRAIAAARRSRSVVDQAIGTAARLRPLDMLTRYLAAGSMAACDPVFADSHELYEQIKRAADYGSDRIDGHEIFFFHRRRMFRRLQYEFAFKFYAVNGEVRHDAIEVCWCEIPLEQLLSRCSTMADPGLREYSVYRYDDEYQNLGCVVFANGRSLDFSASGRGDGFTVVMLYGRSDDDESRAASVRSRMLMLDPTELSPSRRTGSVDSNPRPQRRVHMKDSENRSRRDE